MPGYRLAFHDMIVGVEDSCCLSAPGFSIVIRTQWPLFLEQVPPLPLSLLLSWTHLFFPYSGLFECSPSNKQCSQDSAANLI